MEKELEAKDLIGKKLLAVNKFVKVPGKIIDEYGTFELTEDVYYDGKLVGKKGDTKAANGMPITFTMFPQYFIDRGELEVL